MGLETATYIEQLNTANPLGTDSKAQGDNHIRLIKAVLKAQFPNLGTEALNATAAELNVLSGATATTEQLNVLSNVTATAAELNTLAGILASTTELNFVDGVTSAIQAQIDSKQDTLTAGDNVSIDAGVISSVNTIGGPPDVVVGHSYSGSGITLTAGQWLPLEANTLILNRISATENDQTVTLPAGNYYFEGTTELKSNKSDTINDVRLQLHNSSGAGIGYVGAARVGDWSSTTLNCMGVCTGGSYQLKAFSDEGSTAYGASGNSSSKIISTIKFWKY